MNTFSRTRRKRLDCTFLPCRTLLLTLPKISAYSETESSSQATQYFWFSLNHKRCKILQMWQNFSTACQSLQRACANCSAVHTNPFGFLQVYVGLSYYNLSLIFILTLFLPCTICMYVIYYGSSANTL